jgi:hypothetical protein
MKKNLLQIFRRKNTIIDDQQILDYLSGRLSGTARYEVESWLADQDDFGHDALEGLQLLKEKEALPLHLQKMNSDLSKVLRAEKKRSRRKGIGEMKWIYLSIVLILIFILAGYLIISHLPH